MEGVPALDHNHDAIYSLIDHNHNSIYSLIDHEHDITYDLTDHEHKLRSHFHTIQDIRDLLRTLDKIKSQVCIHGHSTNDINGLNDELVLLRTNLDRVLEIIDALDEKSGGKGWLWNLLNA